METIKYKTSAGLSNGVRDGDLVKYLGEYFPYTAIILKKRYSYVISFDILMLKSGVNYEIGKIFTTEFPNVASDYIIDYERITI